MPTIPWLGAVLPGCIDTSRGLLEESPSEALGRCNFRRWKESDKAV